MAKLSHKDDTEWVLTNGPWLYMGRWAVLVERWEAGKSLKEIFKETVQLIVHVHNFPLEMKTEGTSKKCAVVAGRVLESIKTNTR